MPNYMLFLYETIDVFDNVNPQEMPEIILRYTSWKENLQAAGKISGPCQKLEDGKGRVLRTRSEGLSITDGPHAERREVIAGFFTIEADNYDDAAEVARDCPHLEYGTVEIRMVEV